MSKQFLAIIGVLLFTTACGKEKPKKEAATMDPVLAPYATTLASMAASVGGAVDFSNMHVRVGDTPPGVLAVMITPADDPEDEIIPLKSMVISPTVIAMGTYSVLAVMGHEYGHYLGKGHDTQVGALGRPVDLMYTYAISGAVFQTYWQYYLARLFDRPTASFADPNI